MSEAIQIGQPTAPSRGLHTELRAIEMARWPRHTWTTLFTYAAVFILFPVLCWLAYVWVRHGI